jgi:integrase
LNVGVVSRKPHQAQKESAAVIPGRNVKAELTKKQVADWLAQNGGKASARLNVGRGIYLIFARGRARWAFRYTSPATGRVTETGLGTFEDVPLKQARDDADKLRQKVRAGIAPNEAKRQELAAVRLAAAPKDEGPTFSVAAETLIAPREAGWSKDRRKQVAYHLRRAAKPLAAKPVATITSQDVKACLAPLWSSSPVSARAALASIGLVFGLAVGRGWRSDNPARWEVMKHFLPSTGHQREHRPSLAYTGVQAFVQELRAYQATRVTAKCLEVIIHTACRAGEVLGARWSEVDLEKGLWTIPAPRMKARREHVVPLTDQVLQVLRAQYRVRDTSGLVFPSPARDGKPMHGSALRALLKEMGRGGEVTIHGFRSTARSWLGSQTDCPFEVAESILAHQPPGGAVVQAYLRDAMIEKKRVYLKQWSDFIEPPAGA